MALTKPNWSTIDHSHARETNSRQPSASSAKEVRRLHAQRGGQADQRQEQRCEEERRGVDGDPDARAGRRDHQAAESSSTDETRVAAEAEERVGGLKHALRNGLRHDANRCGEEEG
jgi:hypothetical protein